MGSAVFDAAAPAFQVPQTVEVASVGGPQNQDQANAAWIRTLDAFKNYHKRVPLQAFGDIRTLIYISNNWSKWGTPAKPPRRPTGQ